MTEMESLGLWRPRPTFSLLELGHHRYVVWGLDKVSSAAS